MGVKNYTVQQTDIHIFPGGTHILIAGELSKTLRPTNIKVTVRKGVLSELVSITDLVDCYTEHRMLTTPDSPDESNAD